MLTGSNADDYRKRFCFWQGPACLLDCYAMNDVGVNSLHFVSCTSVPRVLGGVYGPAFAFLCSVHA